MAKVINILISYRIIIGKYKHSILRSRITDDVHFITLEDNKMIRTAVFLQHIGLFCFAFPIVYAETFVLTPLAI